MDNKIKVLLLFISCFLITTSCKRNPTIEVDPPPVFISDTKIRALDLSFLPQMEEAGMIYKDENGKAVDLLDLVKAAGVNTIRVRIWHQPKNQHSGLNEVKLLAQRIKAKNLKLWLCIHYSDTWADPGNQEAPKAWSGLSFPVFKDSLVNYTKMLMRELQPNLVQAGNEINGGFCWEIARFDNGNNFFELLNAANVAIKEVSPNAIRIVHYAGIQDAGYFFHVLKLKSVDYDWIGLSYYPLWHGKSPDTAGLIMDQLFSSFNKPVMIAETAYPFTLGWNDWTNNVVGDSSQLVAGYPPTLAGQKDFLNYFADISQGATYKKGFCYWGAEWVAFDGPQSKNGSTWENQALFDFNNKVVPAMGAFKNKGI
ncbi:MAG: glycoside hydrolase family 53 protein [Bacteroidia bacterium]